MLMNLAQSSLPSEGHRLFLQLRSELQAVLCTRSRPTQPLLEPDWRSSSDLTCISSSTRTWDRAAGERDQRSGEIELAEKNRIEPFVLLDLAVLVIRFPSSSLSPLTCCRGTTLCGGQSLLSPELHDHAPRGLLMTSKFDPDGLVKRRTLRPSQSGIGPARDLEGVSQPPDAPAPPACGPAARERARCPRLPLPPPMGGSSPLHLLLGPAAPATGVGGRPGPGPALGPPPSRQRPPWGCWAWWWWLGGVEPPVTGLAIAVSGRAGTRLGTSFNVTRWSVCFSGRP